MSTTGTSCAPRLHDGTAAEGLNVAALFFLFVLCWFALDPDYHHDTCANPESMRRFARAGPRFHADRLAVVRCEPSRWSARRGLGLARARAHFRCT